MNAVQIINRPAINRPELRRRRRPALNELSRSSRSSLDQSDDFILIGDNEYMDNSFNIHNQSQLSSRSIPTEEEIIKTRGRKKTKCSPFLRDLSPNTLATIKSPIKNSKNEDLLRFLRSPTPRKCKLKIENDSPSIEIKRARKSLIIDLNGSLNENNSPMATTSTPTSAKKRSTNKKTVNNSNKKRKSINSLKRSTNIKT